MVEIFSPVERLRRQALQVPFALLAATILGGFLGMCFGIEVFLSEVYSGPFKSILIYIPTGLLTTLLPMLSAFLTKVATTLNDYENYETEEAYNAALTAKIFVLNFVTSYLPICLTAFVYVPFASIVVPYLDIFSVTARPFAEHEGQLKTPSHGEFKINPARLRSQYIYFTVTAQIVNFALEVVVPFLKRQGFIKYQDYKSKQASKKGGSPASTENDPPEEKEFLARVRSEVTLGVYDVTGDLREMVVQFGYLALFSVIWPLAPVSFLINNWVELRSDAFKICIEMQRPTPHRADSIGPWIDSLSLLAWIGSITMSALTYMFSDDGLGPDGSPSDIRGWALLLSVFFAEHLFIIARLFVRFVIAQIDSPGQRTERAERFTVRKRYLEDQFGAMATEELPRSSQLDQISRSSLEEDERLGSLRGSSQTDRFWNRQRSWEESAKVGAGLIQRMAQEEGKKTK